MEESKPCTTEPDADTIKMFVGQIPRHWNEPECRKLFEKYGPVYSLNILRDKASQSSKGCCFVTYYHRKDSISAQAALHNIEVIEGMHHPVQMKPADTENRNERKLFVGQLSKKHTEEDVRTLFAKFGHIEDCSVLRDGDNRSRGCAFVTFATRNCAINATKEMHHSQTMEGCTAPLVVKFADTQRDKDGKGKVGTTTPTTQPPSGQTNLIQQLNGSGINLQTLTAIAALLQQNNQQQNVLGLLGSVLSALGKLSDRENGGIISVSSNQSQSCSNSSIQNILPQLAALLQQSQPQGIDALAQLQQVQLAQQQQQMLALLSQQQQQQQQQAAAAAAVVVTQDQNQANNIAYQSYQGAHVVAASTTGGNAYAVHNPIYQTAGGGVLSQNGLKTASPVAITTPSIAAQMGQTATAIDPLQQAIQQYALTAINPNIAVQAATAGVGNGDVKGPNGSNLFIYHLPQDFGDSDLMSTFSPFGTVLSAKVFIDKVTNLSKCFGFVSYDNALSAQNAISAMNGFQIGSKRLKVQLKNERTHPYTKVN
ncbi:unnamed protein product [Auanema sp. JU1783]|nr:unnamed protein product [Auanema sp. JU1783]